MANVLIACEFSGIVRDAFIKKGHNAFSCDLLDSELPGPHFKDNVLNHLHDGFDLMIAHPPCTYLCVTGNKWFYHPDDKDKPIEQRRPHPRFPDRREKQKEAIDFFNKLLDNNIPKICIENPIGIMSSLYRKPDQIIQPFEFGHSEPKKTCLWLKNLPLLKPTKIVKPEYYKSKSGKNLAVWYYKDAAKLTPLEREKMRSRTFEGIAEAMADQWGSL